jgi:hypothetical protein
MKTVAGVCRSDTDTVCKTDLDHEKVSDNLRGHVCNCCGISHTASREFCCGQRHCRQSGRSQPTAWRASQCGRPEASYHACPSASSGSRVGFWSPLRPMLSSGARSREAGGFVSGPVAITTRPRMPDRQSAVGSHMPRANRQPASAILAPAPVLSG